VAYRVLGEASTAPILVQANGLTSHVELRWDHPMSVASMERLASFSRLVLFDRRGAGLSDPLPDASTADWEGWTDDLRAVLDAVGCERAAILAGRDAGPTAMLFAATYPERTSALLLVNTAARFLVADDYACGFSEEAASAMADAVAELWGSETFAAMLSPNMADDPSLLNWLARYQRASATPRAAAAQFAAGMRADVREVLPLITVPTLVLHRSANQLVPIEMGRYLAEHIACARLVELPGSDQWINGDEDAEDIYNLIEEEITGARQERPSDRVFATVLVEDIVGSTQRAVAMGDGPWKLLLDRHDAVAHKLVGGLEGRIVKMTGDGIVAIFDSPSRAIRCGETLREQIRDLGLELRTGIHAGEIERRGDDVAGVGVHTAARVSALAHAGEVLVSRTVKDLVAGSGLAFTERGTHTLKGVQDDWQLYAVATP
jgi:class 3 adenylate cyclase